MHRFFSLLGLCLSLSGMLASCGPSATEVVTFYSEGDHQIKEQFSFLGDDSTRRDGPYTAFFPNGNPLRKYTFRDGRLWEVVAQYGPDGAVLDSASVKEGKGILKIYNLAGVLVGRMAYEHGVPSGTAEVLDGSGQTVASLHFRGGLPVANGNVPPRLDGFARGFGPDTGLGLLDMRGARPTVQVDPTEADRILQLLKNQEFTALSAAYASKAKQAYGIPLLLDYFKLITKLFGSLESFRRVDAAGGEIPQTGVALQALYEAKFKYVKAAVVVEMLKEAGQFKVVTLAVQPDDFAPIGEVRALGDPVMERLKAKDWAEIYADAGPIMKSSATEAQFTQQFSEAVGQLGTLAGFDLASTAVVIADKKLGIQAVYLARFASGDIPMGLTFLRNAQGVFQLEGIEALPANPETTPR